MIVYIDSPAPRIGETPLRSPYGRDQIFLGPFHEAGDHGAGTVPGLDLGEPVLDGQRATIRPGGEVAVNQGVGDVRLFDRKFVRERPAQSALRRLDERARMVCYKCRDPRVGTMRPQPPGTVERMEAGVDEVGGITDVVQPCRGGQDGAVGDRKRWSDPLRLPTHRANMIPTSRHCVRQ